jgi:uncharacterized protein (DUF1800 family)
MPLPSFTGTLGIKRAAHLLRRAAFGGTKADVDAYATLTAPAAVSNLFSNSLPDPILPIDPLTNQEWITNGPSNSGSEDSELQEYFKGWLIGQMLGSGQASNMKLSYQVREKVVLFMHTHFTTKQSVVSNSRSLYFQNQLFRVYSLDKDLNVDFNFKNLTKKICLDNAMLKFLDGRLNVKGNPNENFARELMELYTIGRGLEGTLPEATEPGDYFNYKEQDVQEAARILSGFDIDEDFITIDLETNLPRGRARGGINATQHDTGSKQFSDRLANAVISPDPVLIADPLVTNEEVAIDEISQLIELLYSKNETARHICRKIYRFFVYHDISSEVESNIIGEMANTFIASGYKIQNVIEELLASQHFYDANAGVDDNNFGGIIKSPLDLILETIQFFELSLPDYQGDLSNFYEVAADLLRSMDYQGLDFYEPFEVAGYSAYHQYPVYNRNWISTNYLTRRYDFIRQFLDGMDMMGSMNSFDLLQFIRDNFPNNIAENAETLIISLVEYLLPVSDNLTFSDNDDSAEVTNERLRYFRYAFLFDPQIDADPLSAWTYRWNNPVDNEVVRNQLKNLMNSMLQSPEYQLM